MDLVPDLAQPGRARRLALALLPSLVMLLTPPILVAVFGDRLPPRAYTGGLVEFAPSWDRWKWMSAPVAVIYALGLAVIFVRWWRWPGLQRWLVTSSFATAGFMAGTVGAGLGVLIDADGPVPEPGWMFPVASLVALAAGLAGWHAAGPPPTAGTPQDPPPAGLPAMTLGSQARAIYVVSGWSNRRLLRGVALLAFAALLPLMLSPSWPTVAIFVMIGMTELLQARTRLQIDGRGMELTLPWLGRLRRFVPYAEIRSAEARPSTSGRGLGLVGGPRGWGYVSGPGPVLALRLTDGREFLYSTRDAESAAALVNGSLHRLREGTTGADRR
ncbi:hypothetical protein Sru01_00260 [Sphaerisporangium rufum]|uniref:DUF1648 domain-containing protein n=1 Tax=Sphaerisporangium rufum TaxID=1381558 RepID=A0A919UWP7_9ACTN|nr:hypothetical protein [Sphaerisporangium rufum]GII75044.1 hypothetical protein Sru01_00260 [Sphaerisporangium rufum]